MNNGQSSKPISATLQKRLIVAGVTSILVYCSLSFVLFLPPFLSFVMVRLLPPGPSVISSIVESTAFSLLILLLPGLAFGMWISHITHLTNNGYTILLGLLANLVLWFGGGAIPATIFKRNRLVIAMWIVFTITIVILGLQIFNFISHNLD